MVRSATLVDILLMVFCYAYMSYLVFYEGDFIENWISKFSSKRVSRYLMGFASYFMLLTIYSIVCFALFNVHINIFFVALAYYMLDRIVHLILFRRSKAKV